MMQRATILRVGAVVFVIAAIAYSVRSFWTGAVQSRGSEKDAITLVCAKCDQEVTLGSLAYKQLARDPQTGAVQCPKCGEKAARIAVGKCPKCGRAFTRQPADAPHACPYCKAPFGADEEESGG